MAESSTNPPLLSNQFFSGERFGVLSKLRATGKSANVTLTAAMRKLIALTNQTRKNPDWAFQN